MQDHFPNPLFLSHLTVDTLENTTMLKVLKQALELALEAGIGIIDLLVMIEIVTLLDVMDMMMIVHPVTIGTMTVAVAMEMMTVAVVREMMTVAVAREMTSDLLVDDTMTKKIDLLVDVKRMMMTAVLRAGKTPRMPGSNPALPLVVQEKAARHGVLGTE